FEATREASALRLRPILMTSFAFVFGVIPLIVASGAGAEMRRSLGIAVFTGMLGVTMFGIFLTPVFFLVIQGLGETRLFSAEATQRWAGPVFAALIGAVTGLLAVGVGWVRFPWGPLIGAAAGALVVLGLRGLWRTRQVARTR